MHCPISLTPVADIEYPVRINSDQHVYELRDLSKWLRTAGTDPMTRRYITWKHIKPAGRDRKKIRTRILHEKMSAVTIDWPQVDYLAFYRAYADNFERFFCIQSNGTLRCDSESRQNVPNWYNNQRAFIHLLVSTEPPMLVLKEPQQGDISTTNWNKTEMIRAYTHALVAYHRVCDVLRRPKSPDYTSDVQVGE